SQALRIARSCLWRPPGRQQTTSSEAKYVTTVPASVFIVSPLLLWPWRSRARAWLPTVSRSYRVLLSKLSQHEQRNVAEPAVSFVGSIRSHGRRGSFARWRRRFPNFVATASISNN